MFGKNQKKNPTKHDLYDIKDSNHNNRIPGVNDL